jgi:hypothetical protein
MEGALEVTGTVESALQQSTIVQRKPALRGFMTLL